MDITEFREALTRLREALALLDRLGLHVAAADVSSALDRMERAARADARLRHIDRRHGSD